MRLDISPFLLLLLAFVAVPPSPRPAAAICIPRNDSNSIHIISHPQAPILPQAPPSPVTSVPSPPTPTPSPSSAITTPPVPSSPSPASPTPVAVPSPPSSTPSPPSSVSTTPAATAQLPAAPAPPVSGIHEAVGNLCGHTDYPDLCLSSVDCLLPPAGKMDAPTLLNLQMKACRNKVNDAQSQVSALVGNPQTGTKLASYLRICSDSYDDSLDNLDAAAKAVASRDLGTLNSMLSALATDFETCEDGFQEIGVSSPMSAVDGLLSKMASNCLAIAQQIKP